MRKPDVFDASSYQKYAARAEAEEANRARPIEMPAIRPKGPLKKHPEGYRDRSDFVGMEQRASLKSIREKAPVQKAVEIARVWDKKRTERWIADYRGSTPQAIVDRLERQLEEMGDDAKRKKELLFTASEALHHLRQMNPRENPFVEETIKGIEEFLGDQALVVSPESKATWKKLKTEERAAVEQAKVAEHARETPAAVDPNAITQLDMTAFTPENQDWFDKGERGEFTDDEDDNLGGGMVGRLSGRH